MGGLNSEITENTTQLLFEAAKFARDNVRRTSRSLGQSSDSSARFEKGISEYITELGMARALHLIQELNCGEITASAFDCSAGAPREGKHFTASLRRINGILGIEVPADTVMDILKRLNFDVKRDGDTLDVIAPRYREDIEVGEPDLAEEVIREYGYDHVVPTFLQSATVTSGGKTPAQQRRDRAARILCAQGYNECYTLSFYADSDLDALKLPADAPERSVIRIQNPISEKLSVMRPLLAPSLLNVVVDNLKKGNNEGRLFEISNVYVPAGKGEHPEERPHLGLAAFGDAEDFFTVKGTVEALGEAFRLEFDVERAEDVSYLHPGIAAYILCEGERIGVFGKLANEVTAELKLHKDSKANHKIFLGEIDYERMMSHAAAGLRYKPVSAFPETVRDLALTVSEETTCGALMGEIRRACPAVSDVELFDIYRGEQVGQGKKSMAFKIRFESREKALTPDEVDKYIKKILGNLKFKLGAEIR